MAKIDYKAVLERCNELTKTGKILIVKWDGGNDSGTFELILDERELYPLTPIDDMIIDMIAEEALIYSFDGPQYNYGSVQYDPASACFLGSDTSEESDSDVIKSAIQLSIPKEIWFDRLDLGVAVGYDEDLSEVRLTIQHGPRGQAHADMEDSIKALLLLELSERYDRLGEATRASVQANIARTEFQPEGDALVYTISKVEYAFIRYENTVLDISLIDKIQDNDSL